MLSLKTHVKPVLYFSHPRASYSSKEEKLALKVIKEKGYRILNPNELNITTNASVLIKLADAFVVMEFNGYIGRGVYEEILEAKKFKKQVFVYEPGCRVFLNLCEVKVVNKFDWKNYAKIQTMV